MSSKNLGASIRDRLLNKARVEKLDFNLLLTRYALERMLYRLSISKQRDQFLLKGALLAHPAIEGPRARQGTHFASIGQDSAPKRQRHGRVVGHLPRLEVEPAPAA